MDRNLLYSFNESNEMQINNFKTSYLAKKFSTPLYILNEVVIRDRCKMFSEILSEVYKDSLISYASKAFCCTAIYKIIKDYNFACDVVSGGEIATVVNAKFDASKVYFHGNNKTLEEIKFALKNKIFNFIVDNESELETLVELANNKKYKKKINVIVRINPGVEAHTHEFIKTSKTDSKFGINLDNAESFIEKVNSSININFLGLHFHIGSQIFDYEPFMLATRKTMEFVKLLKSEHNIDVKTINVGGGFGVWYTDEDPNLSYNDYKKFIEVIAKEINKGVEKNNLIKPTLVIEPGRSIVAEAGMTLYTAGNIKDIRGIRKYISIDGGMFENPRYALYGAKYTAIKCNKKGLENETVTIVGKCCESGDIIIKDINLEKIEKGDLIAVLTTGAYNYSMASNYNRNPIPPVVLVNETEAKLIVKGQTYKDLIRFDV